MGIYIRNVNAGRKRSAAIAALAERTLQAGAPLVLAGDTLTMARHAAKQGWIAAEAVAAVGEDAAHQGDAEQPHEQPLVIEPPGSG